MQISIGISVKGTKTSSPPSAPVNTVAPAVDDSTTAVQYFLTTSNGSWTGSPTSYTYQWYRVPQTGGSNDPIIGGTSNSYELVIGDEDYLVTCEVTAINAIGSSSPASSNSCYVYDYDYWTNVYTWTGYTTVAQSYLQNRLMMGIKSSGAWAKLDLFMCFATDGVENIAGVNWKGGGSGAFGVNSPTFTANQGFTGNGVDAYIDTQFDPYNMGTNYQQDNASRYFFPYAFSGAGPMDGLLGAENRMLLAATNEHKINQDNNVLSGPFEYTNTVEPKSIHRTGVNSIRLYNGTVAENRTVSSATLVAETQKILTSDSHYAGHVVAAYAMGANMVAENTAFIAAWNTYITSI